LGLVAGQLLARPKQLTNPRYDPCAVVQEPARLITPDMEFKAGQVTEPSLRRDEVDEIELHDMAAIGDDFVIGYTWYDYQHNGSIGKMIARDPEGAVHFIWMEGYNSGQQPRHVAYNMLEDGDLIVNADERTVVNSSDKGGYACLSLIRDDWRGIGYFHESDVPQTYVKTAQGTDWVRRAAAFASSYPPLWPDISLIWPHGDIDSRNFSHVFAHEYDPAGDQIWARVAYWRGTPVDERFSDWEWTDPPINVDTVSTISQTVAASMTTNRVVLGWNKNRVGSDLGPWDNARGPYQHNNDVCYILSNDGENWDWENGRTNITRTIPPDPELEPDLQEAYGDTFRPYCDLDIQFDPWDDNLFAVFAAGRFYEDPSPEGDDPPGSAYAVHDFLWFWNSVEDTITMIANGDYYNYTPNAARFRCGAWRYNCDRGSIAFNPDAEPGTIYVVWCQFPKIMEPIDLDNDEWEYLPGAADTSRDGYVNAEIMVSISTDWGITWQEPINITGTRWDGEDAAAPGECMNENWPSAALIADDTLHIQYVFDLDAGGIPQDEGQPTNNPVIYHRVALEDLDHNGDPVELPREGFQYHNYPDIRPVIDEAMVLRDPGTPTPATDVTITADVIGGGDYVLESVELLFAFIVDDSVGAETEVAMENIEDDMYSGVIPGQQEGTVVCYRIRAVNDTGFVTIAPRGWRWAYVVREEGGLTITDIQQHPRQWGVDYSFYRGYEVTVTGTVTTPAQFNQIYGAYAIQDGEGYWSGVFARGIEDDLNIGDRITVTGTVFERDPEDPVKWRWATYIDVTDYAIVGQVEPVEPYQVSDAIDLTINERAEHLEGVLVEVLDFEAASFDGDPETMDYWPITDETMEGMDREAWITTIGMSEEDINETGVRGFRQGTRVDRMIGVFTENYGHYAATPRDADDFGEWSVPEEGATPYRFGLDRAYPNPFNATTNVGFELNRSGQVHFGIYDLSGRLVASLVDGELKIGHYNFTVDASSLSAGVYILRLETDLNSASQKLVLLK